MRYPAFVCLSVRRISKNYWRIWTKILWNNRASAKDNRLDFGIDWSGSGSWSSIIFPLFQHVKCCERIFMKYLGVISLRIRSIRLNFGNDPDLDPGSIFPLFHHWEIGQGRLGIKRTEKNWKSYADECLWYVLEDNERRWRRFKLYEYFLVDTTLVTFLWL